MTFDDWFETVKEIVVENCENRMDQWDAEGWMNDAFEAGLQEGLARADRGTD